MSIRNMQKPRPPGQRSAFTFDRWKFAGRAEAIVVVSSRLMSFNRQRITEFAAQRRVPLVCGAGPWAEAGSLLSYGPDIDASVRRAAWYVDRILKGADPAKLPVEQPTKFELVINLKAAKTLGLAIPQSVLQRARPGDRMMSALGPFEASRGGLDQARRAAFSRPESRRSMARFRKGTAPC